MPSIFTRPSQVIARLRAVNALGKANVTGWPTFEVHSAGANELAELALEHNTPACLFVMVGSSNGTPKTFGGVVPTTVTHTFDIAFGYKMSDIRGSQADEWSVFYKEFLITALHGYEFISGQTPLYFSSESPVVLEGHALYIRMYQFAQEVEVRRTDLDFGLGDWDDLEWFRTLVAEIEAEAPPFGDTAAITVTAEPAGPFGD